MEGARQYEHQSVRARIAKGVEGHAGQEFGPEELTRETVACALNLSSEDLSEEEWNDISEFAVNAGAELLQTSVNHDPLPDAPKEEEKFLDRMRKNKYRTFPIHDLFHAAEVYRAAGGATVKAPFVEVPMRERYTNPDLVRSELWPALFLVSQKMNGPFSVLLSSPQGRRDLNNTFGAGSEKPNPFRKEITAILETPVPSTSEDLQAQYERLVGLIVIANAVEKVPDITADEVKALQAAARTGEDSDPHYDRFAKRVFSGEWRENKRLFLDELLECVRSNLAPK